MTEMIHIMMRITGHRPHLYCIYYIYISWNVKLNMVVR